MTVDTLVQATLTAESIAEQREYNYRRTLPRRLRTVEDARAFVQETGFCLFAACNGVEMPNFFHAIAGRTREVPDEHHDPDVGKWWGWKDDSLDKRWWYYGKLIRKRAAMVSLDLLPYFYACSENYGDYEHDYLEEYRDGKFSAEAKAIYEALLENGPLHTVALRQKAHMTNDSAKYRFEKTLTDLQAGLKVLPVGVAAAGAWHYAFIYDIVPRYYADIQERARPISRREAQKTLLLRHLANVVAAPRAEVFKALDVLGWTNREFEGAVETLIGEGALREEQMQGAKQPLLVIGGE
jgi:hypothetical protein